MKDMVKRFVSLIIMMMLLLSFLPLTLAEAAYANGYSGGKSGDGSGIYAHGVDLSSWQGDSVDFEKIKAEGYHFVILRAGFACTIDRWFEQNYQRAKEAGLDVGVYLYSYAENTEEALAEAQACIGFLEGKTLEYPVYYDLEDPEAHGSMSKEDLTQIALTFLDEMAKYGWLVGLYSCKSWLESKMDTDAICETYECWMAQFVDSGTYDIYDRYDEVYGMWQYSCTGTVDGVSGGVDLNVCFKDYPGICRRYGFNGYAPSEESLILSGVSAPKILLQGEKLEVIGKVSSSKSNLTSVTVGIYSLSGEMLCGRSAGPKAASYDLSALSSGVKAQELPEGSYLYRISAGNSYESRILLNQPLIISQNGIFIEDLELPMDLKQGEDYQAKGNLLSAYELQSVKVYVTDESGNILFEGLAHPDHNSYDLSLLNEALAFSELATGKYVYYVEVKTEKGTLSPVSEPFHVWQKEDPVELQQFRMESEYRPGELTGLNGVIRSEKSNLQQVNIEIFDSDGQTVARVVTQPDKQTVTLSDYNDRLDTASLPFGSYRLRIAALNDGGPVILLNRRFLISKDALSLCELEAPHVLRLGDSFLLEGAVCSDSSTLTFVAVSVTDRSEVEVMRAAAIPVNHVFDLSALNDRLLFSTLSYGSYKLRIFAENESGGDVLYEAPFYVIEKADRIYWKQECADPRGIAYSQTMPYTFSGVLCSERSYITEVLVEVLDEAEKVMTSARLQPQALTVSLASCNEMLRVSALPDGSYTLRVTAVNHCGSFVMLNASFAVNACAHGSIRSGTVHAAGCISCGAVTDSRCLDCGEKVRSGILLAKTEHNDRKGRCIGCGKGAFLSVNAMLCTQSPVNYGRYVIAARIGEKWYALSPDGSAVPISAPDRNGMITLSAQLLWACTAERGKYYLTNPYGRNLHIDSGGVVSAKGTANADLKFCFLEDGWQIRLASEPTRVMSFENGTFSVDGEDTQLYLFAYIP